MRLIPKNWASFQHYKDRSPPWIKLHKNLLDDRTFQRLPIASRALAPMLWLLASESSDGSFDGSIEELSFRLRTTDDEIRSGLTPLIHKGFFLPAHGDSDALAECLQAATPEREAETEAKKEGEGEAPRKRVTPAAVPRPDDVFDQTWADWLQLRKAKRAPVTATVLDGARAEAAKAGMPLQEFLAIWCRRGSQTLEASWLRDSDRRPQQQPAEPAWRSEQRQRTQLAAPGVAAGAALAADFFDVEARPLTPALGAPQ